jgi:NADPH2:quinone reductase
LLLPAPYTISAVPHSVPLVINGAGTAVGSFAAKMASATSGIKPIIALAGSNADEIKSFGADVVLNYRDADVAAKLLEATGGKVSHVFDAFPTEASIKYLLEVLKPDGRYVGTTKLAGKQKELLDAWGGYYEQVWVGSVHDDRPAGGKFFGAIMARVIEQWISEGKLKGHNHEVVPGGLSGVDAGLRRLKDGKVAGAKLVYRIEETPGL